MSKKEKNKKVQNPLEEVEKNKKSKKDTIAIIGISGFLPESDGIQDFWEKLDRQENFIKTIPDDHDPENSVKYNKGSFIKNLRGFDAKLFHIISKEAKYMTPHQRLLLMSVWNLFEDACILPSSLEGKRVAVIIGKETNPYMEYLNKAPITTYTCLGMGQGYLPNRISNFFNFKGPSYSIDTSCSGGLTALHQGKELLKNNEVDYVVVAGVNLMYGKEWTRSFFSGSEAMGLITTDNEGSMPFQEGASGFVPSEGVVSFLLKRSNEAVADKDNIHAYVLGSATNHVGGVGNIAFPDAGQQSKAIIAAYEEAAVLPETVTYVEAHAASSTLADAQEIEAFRLADAHFWNTDSGKEVINTCKISTSKPNIGHMHAASGLVSLVRLIYSFKEGKKLGIKDFKSQSNEFKLNDSRYYISAETDEWPRLIDQKREIPRRGAVNNYGGGGSIVHAVLEEYIPDTKEELVGDSNENVFFLTLSSTEEFQFLPYAKSIKHFLEKNPACSEKQLEYHYLLSRKELNKRIVFRYKSIKDLLEKLIKFIKSEGKLGYYVSGSVDVGASLNELFQKNKKVVAFLNGLQDKNDKSLLFDLWVKGYEEPVKTYFAKESMSKISFPGYPFHLQPYWLDVYSDEKQSLQKETNPDMEPLLSKGLMSYFTNFQNKNIGITAFTGEEKFFTDHIIEGDKVLPGVGYLEMVRETFMNFVTLKEEDRIVFENVMWLNPFTPDGIEKQLEVYIIAKKNNNYDFEIVSKEGNPHVIHSKGTIKITDKITSFHQYDIDVLKDKVDDITIKHDQIYEFLNTLGFRHGPFYQGLEYVKCSHEKVIGSITVSKETSLGKDKFVLSPDILDSALQALVMLDGFMEEKRTMLPFSLDSLVFLKPLTDHVYIVAGYEDNKTNSELQRLYCDLCNSSGEVLIQLKGFIRFPYQKQEDKNANNLSKTIFQEQPKQISNSPAKVMEVYPSLGEIEISWTLEEVEGVLHRNLSNLLGVSTESIDLQTKFTDMGLDSMAGVEWVRLINEHFNLSVSAISTYDYPTIRRFAKYLYDELLIKGFPNKKNLDTLETDHVNTLENKSINDFRFKNGNISNNNVTHEIAEMLAELLGVSTDSLDKQSKFTEMGLDSMAGVEWVRLINEFYDISISAISTYDYPSIERFSDYLQEELSTKNYKDYDNSNIQNKDSNGVESEYKVDKTAEFRSFDQKSDIIKKYNDVMQKTSSKKVIALNENDIIKIENCAIKPENLGPEAFQKKYKCKWNYYTGAMYRGVASEELVVRCANANILSILGYARLPFEEVDQILASLKRRLGSKTYGIGFSPSAFTGDSSGIDMKFLNLFIKHEVPVLELSAHIGISKELVYARSKGLRYSGSQVIKPRLIIGKLSRLELANTFMSPSPSNLLSQLINERLISKEEAEIASTLPICDDIVFEGSSGGYTDQQQFLISLPSFLELRDNMMEKYAYRDPIFVGVGGGIGTPSAVSTAFTSGAEFILTGSINQCTIESGMSSPAKALLEKSDIYDFGVTTHGYALKYGFKIQALTKGTEFVKNSNFLSDLWNRYDSLSDIPESDVRRIEGIFGHTMDEAWEMVVTYKNKHNPDQIEQAKNDPKLKMTLLFVWYYAFTQKVTLMGDTRYSKHFQIHSGAAMGAFNRFVKGTQFEKWEHRHVDEIAALLMNYAAIKLNKVAPNVVKKEFVNESTVKNNKEYQNHSTIKEKNKNKKVNTNQSIAVIGMAGRFPKAENVTEFWENIKNGRNCIERAPISRWNLKYKHEENLVSDAWLGTMDDVDKFDPLFFNISPFAAEQMDPQQRIFLQTSWHCFEDAGYNPLKLSNKKCGVFVGCLQGGYGQKMMQDRPSAEALQGGASSILSARIAYFLDLKGPCMAIDTACSSSLVALSEACNSLLLRQSDMALTGGIHIEDGAEWYFMNKDSNMLSKDGRCFTFDERANGFVAGEGVGCVLLKRLDDAEKDGDNIIGVIKGWGVNQDGATNGITAPSMNSQKSLQCEVYNSGNINPENIQLIEAHGTGTALGDPIEVSALTQSFRTFTDKKNYCALSSVKSNIGHLVAAAGISGVIKTLMALRHRKLPPTVNFKKLNPKIELKESPFYVNTELQDWIVEENKTRSAAISSFGFSGTNAHIVVEEYTKKRAPSQETTSALILLSAKNKDRLAMQVVNLYSYLKKNKGANLYDIAYTLQLGRVEMEERLAFVAFDIETLVKQLDAYRSGETTSLFTGNIKKEKYDFKEEVDQFRLRNAIESKELISLAEFWVKGISIDWKILYKEENLPNRISLPQYPFARESYWVFDGKKESIASTSTLHPLLHYNESDLEEQKYKSVYTGKENFLSDHVANGEKILPGTAYLELARVAGTLSIRRSVTQLKEVAWLSPIKMVGATQVQEVQTRVYVEGEEIGYEIYTLDGDKEHIHNHGKLFVDSQAVPSNYDLKVLQSQFTEFKSKEKCYTLFENIGFKYGSSFQGIETLWYNSSSALSKIKLSKEKAYVLPPGLLDSALQTCIGISLSEGNVRPLLPFSVKEVTIYTEEFPETVWSYVKKSSKTKNNSRVMNYNIDVFNEKGEVLIKFRDFVMLPLNDHIKQTIEEPSKTQLYSNDWSISTEILQQKVCNNQLILVAGGSVVLADRLREALEIDVIAVTGDSEETYFLNVLKEVKEKTAERKSLNITVICEYNAYSDYGFVSGLLKSVHQENSKITGKIVGVDSLSIQKLSTLVEILETEQSRSDSEVRYIGGVREVKSLTASLLPLVNEAKAFKEGGVYLITGGTGGLGRIFATHINKTRDTKIILTGRSALTEEKQIFLSSLSNAFYYPCDISVREEVSSLINLIKTNHGKIDGIIHAAGIIRDSILNNKTSEEAQLVISPKIMGVKYLDEETKEDTLDFMVFFSSIASIIGNIGQTDYAAANAYLDNYAQYRETKRLAGERQGVTLSISWPLWRSGGMQVDAESEQYLAHKWGMQVLPTLEGVRAMEILLQHDISHGVVLYGNSNRLSSKFLEKKVIPISDTSSTSTGKRKPMVTDEIKKETATYLKKLLTTTLKLPEDCIDITDAFEEYGIDSIIVTKLMNRLNKDFEDLPSTLFFEYQTLAELIDYFIAEHIDRLFKITGVQNSSKTVREATIRPVKIKENINHIKNRFLPKPQKITNNITNNVTKDKEPIAIIGLSGKYPGSDTIDEFWNNLVSGKDCITEIPKDRWDIDNFYDSEKGRLGKSYSKWGGFISDVDKFDPLFFNITPREAKLMDPQERLFLQTVWKTLEDAGYTRKRLQEGEKEGSRVGYVGVYVGVMYSEYQLYGAEETLKGNPLAILNSPSGIANRVSYYLNIHGPSIGIDTMCSSSLTAIHLAVEAIHNGQCSMAIAGGVNLSVHPNKYKFLSHNRFVSDKGRCESFGEDGAGYVPAEGVGSVLLKPLSQAEADGDQIYGIIKGSSLNHGGKTNGYTVPNPNAQAEVIKEAIKRAGVKPEDFSYIEAHGTGTSLGDPIEIAGLSKAFKNSNKKGQYCAIGSVKSNIGHAESAAGISGLTKLLLQFKHKKLVASIHSEVLNQKIKFENTPFKVQQHLEDWNTDDNRPRLSGISSFGAGGSNAHIIVEEYCPKVGDSYTNSAPAILLLSARSKKQLREKVASLSAYLKANEAIRLHDMAYTLQVGREPMTNRLAFISDTIESVVNQLDNYYQGKTEGVLLSDISSDKNDFLLKGKAGESYLKEAIENKEIENLIQLWVKGVSIDWRLLYGDVKPAIISLPTYPFARDRYWYDTYHSNTTSKTKNNNVILQSNMKSIWEDNQEQEVDNHVVGKEIEVKLLEGGIALVQMNSKATSNMLNKHLMRSLYATFKELRTIPELKVVVLTGVDDVFSMGGDQESLFDIVKGESRFTYMPFAYRGLLDFDVPVITAMQGHAFGGGLVFGMYGDIILLSESATYSANFMKHGFTPGMGATYILGERLGKQLATEMMYTAKLFSGKDIQNRGGSVIVSNSVLKDALQIAKDLSTKPRKSLEVLKQKMSKYVLSELVQHVDDEELMHEQTIHTEEVAARIQEHFEKATIANKISVTKDGSNKYSDKITLSPPTIAINDDTNINGDVSINTASIIQQVKILFSEVLHIPVEALNETVVLSDFGVDSISGVEIVQKVNITFSLSLQATVLYDKNTIAALSEHIFKETKWSNEVITDDHKIDHSDDITPEKSLSDLSFIQEEYNQKNNVEFELSSLTKKDSKEVYGDSDDMDKSMNLEAIPNNRSNVRDYSQEIAKPKKSLSVEDVNMAAKFSLSSKSSNTPQILTKKRHVTEKIKLLFSEILHISVNALNETTVLSDFGVDSISGVEIIQKINTIFSLSLQATILYDKNTITELSTHVLEETNWSPIEIDTGENNSLKSREPIEVKLSETGTPAFTDSIASVLEKPTTVSSTPLKTTETPAEVSNTDMAIIAISGLFPADLDFDSSENNNKIDLSAPLGNKPWNTIDEKNFLSNSGYAGVEETQLQNLGRQHQLIFSAIGLALKKSGISFQELSGTKTGVFIAANDMVRPSGNSEDQMVMMLPNKVSYHLNLIGPSEYIFSSCTSVYHAIHKAVQSIEQGECDQAIVGGVNIIDEETSRYGGSQDLEKLLSIGKYMRSFDESADGIVRSEGVGVLFLKKKSIAKRDNNKIYGVIRGTSFVHGGKNLSWESPNPKGVKTAIGTSLTKAKIDVDTIDYIEAHGIANPVADAVELSAINAAYKLRTKNPDKKWVIGCTKPLIGHSELASGMASIIKVLSAFERKTMPGIPGLEQVNSELDPDHALLLKNDTAYWKNGTHPRRAGLNSYAVGGANAHIILEEYPQKGSLNDKFSLEENNQVTPTSNQNEIKTTEKEKESGTKTVLLAMTCEVFNIKKGALDLKRSPIDYDFDSIKVVEFLKKVNNYFNIEVKVGKILVADDFESIFQIFETAIEKTIASEKNTENTSKSEKVSIIYPLSEGQKGLWFIQKSTPDTTAYNVPLAICLENNPDSQVIYHAAEQILEAHPILRVVFDVESNGTLYQQVQPTKDCLKKDIQPLRKDQNVKEVFEQLLHQPFDLSKEVVRLHVREDKKNKKTFVLFLIHHIVVDGMSTTLFFTEFVKQFEQLTKMKTAHPISLDTQYFEFVNWEHQYMKSKRGAEDIAYWKEKLKGNIERLELPYDTIPKIAKVKNIGSDLESIDLGREQLEPLMSVAKSMKVNISVLLLSVFKVFMYRLTNKQDIIVSVPTIGRPKQEYGHSIGYYINMMLYRSQVSGSQTFASFVNDMRSSFNTDMDYLSYPYPKLLTELEINKQGGHNLFPVSFYYQNIFEQLLQNDVSSGVELMQDIQQEITEEYTLEIIHLKDRLTLQLKYRKDLFLAQTIKRHLKSFHNLLKEVIANPEIKISQVALLDDDEKNRLLFDFNTTETEYPRDKCIHELFEDQVKKTPKAVAVAFAEETITYSELEKRSRQLAVYLQQQGVAPDTLVGVYMERSIDMVVAILSIIRSGGAYVPFDLAYPLERNSYMLQDSVVQGNKGVKLVLTQEHLTNSVKEFMGSKEVTMLSLTSDWQANNWLSAINQTLVKKVASENLVYVIYTSGSTGKPKGVMVNHKSVVNFMCSMQEDYQLDIKDSMIGVTPISFDIHALELYLPLITGAKLTVIPREVARSEELLKSAIIKQQGTIMQATPVTWRMLLESNWQPSHDFIALCGGEAMPKEVREGLRLLPLVDAWNMYGPTETTIWSCTEQLKTSDTDTIGKPIANTQIYILNENGLALQMVGAIGELCIGGDGLARGYLNRTELTAEKFVDNPYGEGKLYRTGDLAKWLPNGTIQFLGRIDHQVKIRGHRIELGEIETLLNGYQDIHTSVVVSKQHAGTQQLVAYCVLGNKDMELGTDLINKYLSKYLPEYMVPSFIIPIEEIPLTSNGKVDRKVLQSKELNIISNAIYIAPETDTEKELVKIWQEVLQVAQIGIEDNFLDMGGNSELSVVLAQKIKIQFEKEISVVEVFQYPTIKSFVKFIDKETPKNDVLEKSKRRAEKRRKALLGGE